MGKLTSKKFDAAVGKASGVMSGISSILGSAMQNAQTSDTSSFEDNIGNLRNTNFDVGDYDTLMSVYNPLALNNMVTFGQVRGGSTSGRVGNVLSATANGAMTGATFGPWGALAGAATGLAAGIGGWIAGDSKAKSRVDELNAENHMASNEYINNFSANAERIGNNMFRNKILNIAACGGLLNHKFAFGGLQPDYSNGATLIRNGGSHESNPYDGVQVGVDPHGVPNLVEEGEVIYDDYVYSNRLKPTKKQLESILLPTKYFGKTYAEIAKDIQLRSDEMPNDPIERAGLEDGMYKLRAIQDETKQRKEQSRFMREFNKLSDDDKFALINGINKEAQMQQQQRLAEEQQMADMQSQQSMGEYDNQPKPNQEAGIAQQMNQYGNAIGSYAYGGNLFPDGGIKYDRSYDFDKALQYESTDAYRAKVDLINKVINNTATQREKAYVDNLIETINNDSNMGSYKINDYNDFLRLATDKKIGPVHKLISDTDYSGNFETIPFIDKLATSGIKYTDKSGLVSRNITNTDTSNFADINEIEPKLKWRNPEWLRYAPLITGAGAAIADLFGANKPDYSLWDNASKAVNRINYVSPTPIGDYLSYNPYDVNYIQGRINAQNAMAQRNILNTAGSNRGAAISGILASHQQGLNNMSDMYRQALEYNDKQRQAVADFNRGTNQTNAQMSLQAQAQNAQLDRQRVSDLMQLAAQKQNIRNASQEAIAGNLTNLATLAGQYGKENVNINQLNKLINSDAIRIGGNTSRNGGKLKRRRK